ncbi:MAG: bifunctional 4-hydroxy-2-oxoglutarate aldolase/2-dehydro-3-deoxy-phosphogluconate aldolase [Burkholderiaceae bacterium]
MALTTDQLVDDGPVIPVILLDRATDAVPLARALLAGGVRVLEITLRTAAALEAIGLVREQCPEAIVGAGTVRSPAELAAAHAAGAQFIVSPGLTAAVSRAAAEAGLPLLPGAVTASEIMQAMDLGHRLLKFFPASAVGGPAALRALASPFADVNFCPTGGIDPANAADYLGLPNVRCVGGSWLTPRKLIDAGAWDQITALARASRGLCQT